MGEQWKHMWEIVSHGKRLLGTINWGSLGRSSCHFGLLCGRRGRRQQPVFGFAYRCNRNGRERKRFGFNVVCMDGQMGRLGHVSARIGSVLVTRSNSSLI